MALDVKKNTSPAPGEVPSRKSIADAILSASTVVPAATVTEQQQIATALSGTSFPVGPSRPLVTTRADARALHQMEVTRDGLVFVPASGVLAFSTIAARDTWTSANGGILSPGDRCVVNGVDYRWPGAAPWVAVSTFAHAGKKDGFQSLNGGQFVKVELQSELGGFTLADSGTSLMFPVAGEYRVTARMYLSGATAGTIPCALHQAGSGAGQIMAWPVYKQDGSPSNDAVDVMSVIRPFPAGSGVRMWANAANASAWGVSGYDGAYLEVELIR